VDVDEILEQSEDKLMMLTFTTDWSGASHIQNIFIDQLSTEFEADIDSLKFDYKTTDSDKLDYFSVNTIPTTMLLKERKVVGFWEGLTSKNRIRKVIEANLD